MNRASFFVLLLASSAMAGCFTRDGPNVDGLRPALLPGKLHCLEDGRCNLQATLVPEERQANELSIAVNPTNPDNIIVTGKDYTPDYAGQCVWDGLYATRDGGKTWTNQNLPGSPWKALNDPASAPVPPPETSKFWCATDPVVAFGPDGTAYWAVMPYQCDPASGSKTGREFVPGSGVGLPMGGLNDWFWTCSAMYVLVSTDGGVTWPVDRMRQVAFGPRLEHDKMWLSVSPKGKVLLCWDLSSDVDTGSGPPPPPPLPHNAMVCSVSTNKGDSWSDLHDMNNGWAGGLPWVDWGPDDTAWAAFIDDANVLVSRSADGLAWEAPVAIAPYHNPPANAEYGWPGLHGSKFRTFTLPSLAVDRSPGPYRGSLYVTWMSYEGGNADVFLSWSRNGNDWSQPVKTHDDDPALKVDQFMPAVSVGPDGTVDLSWHDRRWDPNHHLFDLAYTYSLDGGRSLAPNLRVSEVSSDEQYSHHQNGAVFLGDYRDSDSASGKAYLVWVDTRHEKADAFVALVER